MGANVRTLFTLVFALGTALCAVAGGLLGPLLAVQVGMGESILILAFVVIVIGGIGLIRGAFWVHCWWVWLTPQGARWCRCCLKTMGPDVAEMQGLPWHRS